METETHRKKTLMMNNFMIIAGILVIIISFTLMPTSFLPTTVQAQDGLDSTHIESVTSTYDALLKAPMMISQAAIVGGVFNHVFLHRVLQSRIQPNYKNNVPVDNSSSLQPLRRLFILLVVCSLTILVTASSLIYLQTISMSSELGLDVSTTFTILTTTSVGPVWILRIITSSIIVVSSILYYILEKKKIKRTTEEEHHTYSKQRKRNLSLSIVLLYAIILSGAISIFSNSVVSHSAALSFLPSLAISINWLHFMAVSIWVGGVFYISVILLVTIRSTINVTEPINQQYETNKTRNTYFLAVLLPYFSLIATISLGIIGVTGLYMAWIHLHTAGALFDTTYGNVLIIKLSAILPMVILGGYHQFRLHDSFVLVAKIGKGGKKSNDNKRSSAATTSGGSNSLQADPFEKFSKTIRIESFIGMGILFITSFLTITSPPSMSMASMAENSNLNGLATSTTTENEIPSFDAFAILVIILSAAVLTGSIISFVRSKREIKKTLDSLHANH
jgi:putative copper export protein